MKLEQFIGIFPNAVNTELCYLFVNWFDEISKQGITMSSMNIAMQQTVLPTHMKKDEWIGIPLDLPDTCFPTGLCQPLWKNIMDCYQTYCNEYNVETPSVSHDFKIHRVQPSGGYHLWHHEHGYVAPYRILAWMIILESPEMGGETEFLHQSMRLEPKVGQLVIWPAFFTHKHRGNPPLKGQKTYVTGWFMDPPRDGSVQK